MIDMVVNIIPILEGKRGLVRTKFYLNIEIVFSINEFNANLEHVC